MLLKPVKNFYELIWKKGYSIYCITKLKVWFQVSEIYK